uniref:Uncharacterized protein n=1 Tax=Phlebotomus papatasi TaxID=29031 RepID=A0A1B0GML3_PHLPP
MSTVSSHEVRVPQKNYYKILGVDANSSSKEIKSAYIRLAKIFHPDAHRATPEAKKHFQDIAEAYEVLSDLRKRRIYDRFGVVNRKILDVKKSVSTNEYFKELVKRQNVIEKIVAHLTFLQAIRGGDQVVKLNLETPCKNCEGVRKAKQLLEKCKCCDGRGTVIVQKNVTVTIPENLKPGQTVDIPSPVDPMKTLRISFNVNTSTDFRQEGLNIHSNLVISLSQALLGDNVPIRGVYRDHKLRIPPGIQSHTILKLPGRGIRKTPSGHEIGDHFVTVIVVIPRKLTKAQLEIIREFAKTETGPKKDN